MSGRRRKDGVITLGEIASDPGFVNRCSVSDEAAAAMVTGKLSGIIRGRYQRAFVPCTIKFRGRRIGPVFLDDTGAVNTFAGKPTWDKLFEGLT